jgi:hypothetical protein
MIRLLRKIETALREDNWREWAFEDLMVVFDQAENLGIWFSKNLWEVRMRCSGRPQVHVSLREETWRPWPRGHYWRAGWSLGLWDPSGPATTKLYKAEKQAGRAGVVQSKTSAADALELARLKIREKSA